MERLARLGVRHRRWWCAGTAALMGAAALGFGSIESRLDARDFLPATSGTEDPDAAATPAAGRIAVTLAGSAPIAPDAAGPLLDSLAAGFARLEGVREVHHRASAEQLRLVDEWAAERLFLWVVPELLERAALSLHRDGIDAALSGSVLPADASGIRPLLGTPNDPLGILALAAFTLDRAAGGSRIQLRQGLLTGPGGRPYLIVIEPETPVGEIGAARALVDGIEGVVRRHAPASAPPSALTSLAPAAQLTIVGRPVSYVRGFDTLFADIRRAGGIALVAAFGILALAFRSPLAPLPVAVPVAVGLACASLTASLVSGLGTPFSLVSWVFVVLLVGLGVDFGIHAATQYWVTGPERGDLASGEGPGPEDREDAAARAMSRTGRGILAAGLSSAAAFASLWLVHYPVLRQVSLLAVVGLVTMVGAALLLLPATLSWTAPSRLPARRARSLARRAAGLVHRRGDVILALGTVVVVAGVLVAPRVPFQSHPWAVALRGNPATADLDRLSRELGSALTPVVITSAAPTAAAALALDRRVVGAVDLARARLGVTAVQSLSRLLPSDADQRRNLALLRSRPELFDRDRFLRDWSQALAAGPEPTSQELAEYGRRVAGFLTPPTSPVTLGDLASAGLEGEVARYLSRAPDGSTEVRSYLYLARPAWAEGSGDRFIEGVAGLGLDTLSGVRVAGEGLRSASHRAVLSAGLRWATLAAVLLVLTVLVAWRRSPVAIALALVPVSVGLAAAAIVAATMGIEINALTLTVVPLLVGLGVDDGIHMVERLRGGVDIEAAMGDTGSAIALTTLTTVGAFVGLLFARFEGLADLGLVGSVGLLGSLAAAVLVVPAAHARLGRRPAVPSFRTTREGPPSASGAPGAEEGPDRARGLAEPP